MCVLVAVALLGVTTAAVLPEAGARAATNTLRAGLGYRVAGGDFVGYYLVGKNKVYCLNPAKSVPRTVSLSSVSRYPGASTARSQQLAYALAQWGDARSRAAAAVQSQVLNTLAGNTKDVTRRSHGLPSSLSRTVAAHVAAAQRLHGPYTVRVSTPRALLPGQPAAIGSIQVSSAGGHGVPDVLVRLTHTTNSITPTVARTNSAGSARFAYSVTDIGQVRITATAGGLASTGLRVSHPHSFEQRMVGAQPAVAAHGSAAFRAAVSGFGNNYACTTTCDGRPVTTLSACAPASRYASRLAYQLGVTTLSVDFPAAGTRACRTRSLRLADGTRVTAAWAYRTPHGWSRPVAAPGAFTVDCPAAPAVTVAMTYDCTRASVTVALGRSSAAGSAPAAVNTSRHRLVLVIGGAASARIYAEPGGRALYSASVACGSRAAYTVQAGVQRASGAYNYGPVASVITP